MSNSATTLDASEFAAILIATLAMTTEAGLKVSARNAPATDTRPAGIVLFISGLVVTDAGSLASLQEDAATVSPPSP